MPRLHLFEFEDQPWFPQIIREGMMDFLRHGISWTNFYEPAAPLIKQTIESAVETSLIELCAGGGGGVLKMVSYLDSINCRPKFMLTDLYPNISVYESLKLQSNGKIDFITYPVDALNVPEEIKGMRLSVGLCYLFRLAPDG